MSTLNAHELSCNAVICRYSEIAIKGANRGRFEQALVAALRRALTDFDDVRCDRVRGRMLLHQRNFAPFTPQQLAHITVQLPKVFGLESFSAGLRVETDLDALDTTIDHVVETLHAHLSADNDAPISYRMRARRSHKKFPYSSHQLEVRYAERYLDRYPQLRLNLDDAQLTIWLEVREDWSFVFVDQQSGPGGLPVGCSGSTLALLSGGIDSPVACYMTMKRGCQVHFLTFHSHPYTPPETIRKVGRLAARLNEHQPNGRYLACNLVSAQKIIRDECNERFRTVLYRRLMTRIATRVATDMHLHALVTGDAVGQVASQTLHNMDVINRATDMLILRPLVGMDKQEIVRIARNIGTFDTSAIACVDSCTVFSPKSPATRSKLALIEAEEAKLDIPQLIDDAIATIAVIDPITFAETPYY